jgi:hypothetical protein
VLKGAGWRHPGLVAFANKLATSAGPHESIVIEASASYAPKTGLSIHGWFNLLHNC